MIKFDPTNYTCSMFADIEFKVTTYVTVTNSLSKTIMSESVSTKKPSILGPYQKLVGCQSIKIYIYNSLHPIMNYHIYNI